MTHIIPKPENLASLVLAVRGEKVMLDSDLAELYGVEARALNQAVARNRNRFPDDFTFQLTSEEWERVRLQTVMSGKEGELLRSQTVISKGKGGRRYIPYAFTEQGVAMTYPMTDPQQCFIHQSEDGSTRIDVMRDAETLWLNQNQLTELFGKTKETISEHVKHISEGDKWTSD